MSAGRERRAPRTAGGGADTRAPAAAVDFAGGAVTGTDETGGASPYDGEAGLGQDRDEVRARLRADPATAAARSRFLERLRAMAGRRAATPIRAAGRERRAACSDDRT